MITKRVCYVVDDDPDDLIFFKLASEAIEEVKLEVVCYSSGNEFLANLPFLTTQPDFVFIDINMPGKNGFDCLNVLNGMNHFRNVKFVMLSTSDNKKDVEKAFHMGAELFLTKPHSLNQLKEMIRGVVRQ